VYNKLKFIKNINGFYVIMLLYTGMPKYIMKKQEKFRRKKGVY